MQALREARLVEALEEVDGPSVRDIHHLDHPPEVGCATIGLE